MIGVAKYEFEPMWGRHLKYAGFPGLNGLGREGLGVLKRHMDFSLVDFLKGWTYDRGIISIRSL